MHCEHYASGTCHSCSLLDTPYPIQLEDKHERARTRLGALKAMAKLHWHNPCASKESGFRTSAKLVVSGTPRRPTLGILGADRRGIDLPGCPIQHPQINSATRGLKRFIRSLHLTPYDVPTKNGELKYILLTLGDDSSLMCRFVLRTSTRVTDIRRALPELHHLVPHLSVVSANIHPTHEAIVEGPEEMILSKGRLLPVTMGDATLFLGPHSFIQTNRAIAHSLYRQVTQWALRPIEKGAAPESLWDLYCGIGGFALNAAQAGMPTVTGVESSSQAITSAISAAKKAGLGREEARFICEDACQWATRQDRSRIPDVLVVNPPRRGIGSELAQWIESSGAPRLIYSSCNLESLLKDLEAMPSYQGVEARLFDMFPHTSHCEIALLAQRR